MSPYVPTALIRAQSDERLARLAALGSERAFESIVERYRQPLLLYARRLVGESRAEDVVQASFVAAWTDLRRGSEIREVKAWLYRVVHNRSLNVLKRSDNSDVPLIDAVRASGPGVAAEVEDRDAIRATLREIADLPERQRVALLAVAVDGRRHRDVGIELGLSEGAVKMLVSRARGTLRAAAGAFVPWPILLRLAGLGGGAGSATGAGGLGVHEVPVRLLALAVRLDAVTITKVFVHDPALAGAHRLERDGAILAQRLVGGVVRHAHERLATALAVPARVDDHAACGAVPLAVDHARGKVLDRVDRLPVMADEEAQVVAVDRAGDRLTIVGDLDVAVEVERIDDPLEEVGDDILRCVTIGHQRRLPERFFFWRGGGGGVADATFFSACLTCSLAACSSRAIARAAHGVGSPAARRIRSCCPTVHRFVVIQ